MKNKEGEKKGKGEEKRMRKVEEKQRGGRLEVKEESKMKVEI